MTLLFIIVLLILIKSGHWRNWKAYYPTILLMMVGDLAFNFITHNHSLWQYQSTLIPSHTIMDLLHVVLSFPCVVMLFLGYMPSGLWKKGIYIVIASIIYAFIEYVMFAAGKFVYLNGWNTLYSFFFDIGLFFIVMVHYKKPLAAWLCIVAIVPLFLWIIQFPFDTLVG